MKNPCRELRELLGVSQVEFAGLIGRSFQSVRAYEKHPTDIPREVIDRIRTVAAQTGHADWAVPLLSDEWRVTAIIYPGETLISAPKLIPPKVAGDPPADETARLDVEVLQLVRSHWSDPRCRTCIRQIGRIFAVGDDDIIEAIAKNCAQFERLADAVREAHGRAGRTQTHGRTDYEGRVESLLADEAALESADGPAPETTRGAGTSGSGVVPVESGRIRKIGGRRRH